MPNHVINRLEFDCKPEKLKEILSSICYDDDVEVETTGIGTIDFNKIVPMPKSLDIESGSNTDRSINLYLTSINPATPYYGDSKMNSSEFTPLLERLNGAKAFIRYNAALTLDEIEKATRYHSKEEMMKLGKTAIDNLMQYGATTWYDWRTRGDTWNTKWNSYSSYYNGDNELCFQTAWSSPHPVIEKLSAMYPEVTIKHRWANEDLWQGCGSHTYQGGKMIDFDYPETDKEQLETAASIWDCDLADYGLMESASGNTYVNIENDIYDLVSIAGQHGLFSKGRITFEDIPKGLFLYHIQGDATGERLYPYKERITVNHRGSIITNEPLDLREKGCIQFSSDCKLNFIDKQLTLAQYIEKDFETKEGMTLV